MRLFPFAVHIRSGASLRRRRRRQPTSRAVVRWLGDVFFGVVVATLIAISPALAADDAKAKATEDKIERSGVEESFLVPSQDDSETDSTRAPEPLGEPSIVNKSAGDKEDSSDEVEPTVVDDLDATADGGRDNERALWIASGAAVGAAAGVAAMVPVFSVVLLLVSVLNLDVVGTTASVIASVGIGALGASFGAMLVPTFMSGATPFQNFGGALVAPIGALGGLAIGTASGASIVGLFSPYDVVGILVGGSIGGVIGATVGAAAGAATGSYAVRLFAEGNLE